MIGKPPLLAGAVHVTVAEVVLDTTALVIAGAPGMVAGMTELDGVDGEDVPMELVAVTVKVYDVPLVSPVTVHEVAPDVVHMNPPGDDVTV